MGSGAVEAMLKVLERYLDGGEDGVARTPAQAYMDGVRHGYELARHGEKFSTPSTSAKGRTTLGFTPPPLEPPLNIRQGFTDLRSGDPDPDPKSTARAMLDAGDSLELFPRRVPLARKRRIPDEFQLTPELRRFAEAGGLDAAQEFAAMRDHYRGNGEARADWPATFREWCRRSRYYQERDRARRGRP